MSPRTLQRVIEAIPTSDGAGVKLRRSLGQSQRQRLDPFLMLDHFSTDNADDYIAGFPAHPHRGFETVTYMLDGHMRHEDHLGNVGELKSGGVQWMTAGRGIIHSEMPQQEEGRMRGFQLWINLPARGKDEARGYRDIQPHEIPVVTLAGWRAGEGDRRHAGRRRGDYRRSDPGPGDRPAVPRRRASGRSALRPIRSQPVTTPSCIVFEGSVTVGPANAARTLETHTSACSPTATRSSWPAARRAAG